MNTSKRKSVAAVQRKGSKYAKMFKVMREFSVMQKYVQVRYA